MTEGADTTPAADMSALLLATLGKTASRAIAIVRPDVVDGVLVDGTILWLSDKATRMDPRAKPGLTLREVYGVNLAHENTSQAAQLALGEENVPVTWGPIPVEFATGTAYLDVIVTWVNGLFFVEYVDRTAELAGQRAVEAADHNFRELLEGLDAGVVLLRPTINNEGRVVDAEIIWSNRASADMWTNKEGLAPGTRVSSVYYDLNDWLDAANTAWRGRAVTRMLDVDPAVAVWTAATETLRRVGDLLVELTIDRSDDQALLDRLDELDHRFRTLVDDLPLTVIVASIGSDTLDFVSPSASELTGYPLRDLNRLSKWASLVHPDDQRSVGKLARAIQDSSVVDVTVRLRRPDDTYVSVSVRSARREAAGHPGGYVFIVSDFTEQQRMIDRIAAGERLETLGRTAGSIAHDFNNLLMIVEGNLDRAQRQFGQESLALSTAHAATRRAAELAGSLLGFARGRPGTPAWVDVATLVHQFEPIMNGALFPHAQLRVEIEPDLPQIWADRAQVEQMLLNLVTNARDATSERGTVTLRASIASTARCHLLDGPPRQPHVALAVSDNGTGMTPEILAKVWEPFFSSKTATEQSGTGLGLSTVHGLAHQHGGHVNIDTTVGEGTTVTIYLPIPSAR